MLSVQQITESIEKLLTIHIALLDISKQKTEVVKTGATGELQPLLMKERRHIQALNDAEDSRQQAVRNWVSDKQLSPDETTISTIIERVSGDEERDRLAEITTELTNVITVLKQQEELNRMLIEQSLRFVDMSLDMLHPSIKQFNYGASNSKGREKQRSVFDSKA